MPQAYSRIRTERRGDIAWVTICRPEDRNSIDTPLMIEVGRVLEETEKSSARAIAFTGEGKTYFIGGADGIEMMQCDPVSAKDFSARIQKLFDRMEASPLILLAAINGLCFGGGFEFALACDLRLASEEARIGLPEVKVGLIPGGGGTQRLPRVVGIGRAMEMILSGTLYKGKEALAIGLVHYVVPTDLLIQKAETVLEMILRNPPYALVQAKRAVRHSQNDNLPQGLRVEREAFSQCFHENYFADRMREQLQGGILKTTSKIPEDFLQHRKEKI
jgi:enoyl-CoA hydratase